MKMSRDAKAPPLPALLRPVCERPERSLVMVDFDGTISEIVDDPALARPMPGAKEHLCCLEKMFGLVAVVSGRPVSFLLDRLELAGTGAAGEAAGEASWGTGLVLVGSHGAEMWTSTGVSGAAGVDAGAWREIFDALETRAREAMGGAALVESKVLGLTLHWRRNPGIQATVVDFAQRAAREHGLALYKGHMCVEMRPVMSPNKGDAVRALLGLRAKTPAARDEDDARGEDDVEVPQVPQVQHAGKLESAVFVGDDVGDLDAFRALDQIAEQEGLYRVKVAVGGPEAPAELLAAADLVVEDPGAVMRLLESLCQVVRDASSHRQRVG